ncbi:carboxyphosphonoenolpyruvate phosphonomutase-like protein [Paecilomyces variotii No. 5]|uniref:Carboxyphosphonoenolpyruvate phosphonomutase-like protein n=1 Tax=Byssochlamys spectabilis (strain No. 5 / NBRC 109023) TaxID=1356009 RepID=V5FIG2_BYSSN|nr:carboxyphosphonoenolpyruvate phosphonomutase-like protein [Paecilomyces variotii No. 5]
MANVQNNLAKSFKALHKPGSPIVLANVYDASSAKAVASLPGAKAIATASYAVAEAAGVKDDDLTSEINLRAAKVIAAAVKGSLKPMTVDIQDGYGEQLEQVIAELLRAGVVGVNIEDYDKEQKKMYGVSEAADRIKGVLDIARQHGVPDFVVNARCDILLRGGTLDEAITRGQAYLAAGATTAFVWGGPSRGGISRDEVMELVKAFDGRLNVLSGGLTTKQLADIGVARISIGPALQLAAMTKLKQDAEEVLQG